MTTPPLRKVSPLSLFKGRLHVILGLTTPGAAALTMDGGSDTELLHTSATMPWPSAGNAATPGTNGASSFKEHSQTTHPLCNVLNLPYTIDQFSS